MDAGIPQPFSQVIHGNLSDSMHITHQSVQSEAENRLNLYMHREKLTISVRVSGTPMCITFIYPYTRTFCSWTRGWIHSEYGQRTNLGTNSLANHFCTFQYKRNKNVNYFRHLQKLFLLITWNVSRLSYSQIFRFSSVDTVDLISVSLQVHGTVM